MLGDKINPIQEAIEQKKKENKVSALGVLNELLDEKDAEIKRLEYTLTGVMHFVDKWLDGEELKQDEVNRAITMREKTLRIIENAKSDYEYLKKLLDDKCDRCIEGEKQRVVRVAREIFEEIEKYVIREISIGGEHVTLFNSKNYAELKKKYTENAIVGEWKFDEKLHTEQPDLSNVKFIDEDGNITNRDDALDWNETSPYEESESKNGDT